MKQCARCGLKNEDDARYCNKSGKELTMPSSRNKQWLWIIPLVVLISGRAVSALSVESPKLKEGKETEPSKQYQYAAQDCDRLFTDVAQQAAHSIEGELVKATKIPEEEENKLGKELALQIEKEYKGKLDIDTERLKYLNAVGQRLISRVERKGIKYHFHVISDDKTVNAFAIPGGGIYFFTGILNRIKNEAQFAGIIAHEIKHVDLRHCIALYQVIGKLPAAMQNKVVFITAQMIQHPYNARTEAEADRRGLELIYSFAYSPYQVVNFWEQRDKGKEKRAKGQTGDIVGGVLGRLSDEIENVTSTHPSDAKRSCLLENHTLKLQKAYPVQDVYVGKWNYENNVSMFEKQL